MVRTTHKDIHFSVIFSSQSSLANTLSLIQSQMDENFETNLQSVEDI